MGDFDIKLIFDHRWDGRSLLRSRQGLHPVVLYLREQPTSLKGKTNQLNQWPNFKIDYSIKHSVWTQISGFLVLVKPIRFCAVFTIPCHVTQYSPKDMLGPATSIFNESRTGLLLVQIYHGNGKILTINYISALIFSFFLDQSIRQMQRNVHFHTRLVDLKF